ncbi:MAG TPA: lysophospholipid acyltransferase family protein [Enhygromyxa sp.]|nr:lysophospholipid acyltransferase family protein [Enhygromyxa sp.]
MLRPTFQHREPTLENKSVVDRTTRLLLGPCRLALRGIAPLSWEGVENLPDEGPALIQSNHVSLFDPWFTITAAGRTIHFLATAAAMRDPVMGLVLRSFGSIPKKKFVTDPGAIRSMKTWVDLGGIVGSYPEGERSWDGELLPLLPGAEALVRLLRVPVIPVRILNADRVMPRWAARRRFGPVKIVFDEPRTFTRKHPTADIRAWLESKLRIDQSDERNHAPVRGRELALGLENPLFRCPRCFAWDALVPSGDEIRCRECTATWRVDTRNQMLGRSGGARSMRIVEARAMIRERNREHFVVDERRFARDRVIASSEPGELGEVTDKQLEPLGRVRMILTPERLRFVDRRGRDRLVFELAELLTAHVEIRRVLEFRGKDGRVHELRLPLESPLKWAELVEHWRKAAQPN